MFYAYLYLKVIPAMTVGSMRKARIEPTHHDRTYLSWKLFQMMGIVVTKDQDADISYYHEDSTNASDPKRFRKFINGKCTDISKSKVHDAFQNAFGYSIAVDPLVHSGVMVSKSNSNAQHDGFIVQGPIEKPEANRVYERLIDNLITDSEILEYRVCVIGQDIPYVIINRRDRDKRFDAAYQHTRSIVANDNVFSDAERRMIIACAHELGLDIGEFDVLRDKQSEQIFIVDANKTPKSPPSQLFNRKGLDCLAKAAASFEKQFLRA